MSNNIPSDDDGRSISFSLFIKKLLTKEQKLDYYCNELPQRKKEHTSKLGEKLLHESSRFSMDNLAQYLEENKNIWRLEKLEMQLQLDYWRSTCSHHIKRRRLTGAEGRALDMEHRELNAKFKRNLQENRPNPALVHNRMSSTDVESSPEIIAEDKWQSTSLESSDCDTP
ncbi:hypothetical protein G6F42_018642 [Rhizopus arrhizus]|nr:hypothetical protein G6F42_018642 [Rhizopus arrhizus]